MSRKSSSGGTSILSILQIIFIVLKLLKVITWSWWIVFIPTWIALGLYGIIFIALFVIKVYYKLKG